MQAFGRNLKIVGAALTLGPMGLLLFVAAVKHLLGVPLYYLIEVYVPVLVLLGWLLGIPMVVFGFVIAGVKSESKWGRRWFP